MNGSFLNLSSLLKLKQQQIPIAVLTAYDASMARVLQDAGIDLILIGDSLGNIVKGEDTTVGVTIEDMVYHSSIVAKGAPNCLRMADMPFASYTNSNQAIENATKLIQQGRAHIVKLEISSLSQLELVKQLVINSIPVCIHLGLLPQNALFAGYKKQGTNCASYNHIQEILIESENAGASLILFEMLDNNIVQKLVAQVDLPVIGIGCGKYVDGQVLVINDILGFNEKQLSFSKNFLQGKSSIRAAVASYIEEVKSRKFPP